jgi:hypothetical protein
MTLAGDIRPNTWASISSLIGHCVRLESRLAPC